MLTSPLTVPTWSLIEVTPTTGVICKPVIGPIDILRKLEVTCAMTAPVIPGVLLKVLRVPCSQAILGFGLEGARVGGVVDLTTGVIPGDIFGAGLITPPFVGGFGGLTGVPGLGTYGATGIPPIIDPILAKRALLGGLIPGVIPPIGGVGSPYLRSKIGVVAGGPIVHPEVIGTGVDLRKDITVVAPEKLVNGDVYKTVVAPIIPGMGGIGGPIIPGFGGIGAPIIPGIGEMPFVGGMPYPGVPMTGLPFESPLVTPSFLEKAKTMLF